MALSVAAAAASGDFEKFSEVPPSPLPAPEKSSSPASFSCHCIVEDVHGRPASRPLSLSITPERVTMPQFHQQQPTPGSFVSPVYDKEMRLSMNNFPSPDAIDIFHSSNTAGPGPAGQAPSNIHHSHSNVTSHNNAVWAGVAVGHQRSGAASQSRNGGHTTLASSVSGLHVTQSGIVIPPIQGIPQPKGLPPPTPVQYAKVKGKGKGGGGPKRSRLAVKGAFSNMTSLAVLQQVQPFQKKTRQVEAAGWSRLDFTPEAENESSDAVEQPEPYATSKKEDASPLQGEPNAVLAKAPSSSVADGPRGVSSTAVAPNAVTMASIHSTGAGLQLFHDGAPGPQPQHHLSPPPAPYHNPHHHSRSASAASQTSLTPSEAAMVAAAWEEDVAAAAAASAAQSQHVSSGPGGVNSGSGYVEDQDDWDRVEAEAMRIQAQMLQQQQQQQQQRYRQPVASESPSRAPFQPSSFVDRQPQQFQGGEESDEEFQQHYQPQQGEQLHAGNEFTPMAPTLLHAATPSPEAAAAVYSTPVAVQQGDPTDEVAPYAVRTAASAKCTPTGQHRPVVTGSTPSHDIYSAHRHGSPSAEGQRSSPQEGKTLQEGAEDSHRNGQNPSGGSPSQSAGQKASSGKAAKAYPIGFEAYAEKGQQRRAEAERARLERAAEAAGEPLPPPPPSEDHATSVAAPEQKTAAAAAEERGLKRARKMSVLPPPRGFDVFAQKGHARRAEVEREEAQRQLAEQANCTYAPRINQRRSTSAGTANATASKRNAHSVGSGATDNDAVLNDDPQGTESSTALAVIPFDESESHTSVFERLNREAEEREARQRQLEQKYTPSFAPQRITAVTAATAATATPETATGDEEAAKAAGALNAEVHTPTTGGPSTAPKPRTASRNVFEDLYALSKKPSAGANGGHGRAAADGTKGRFARTKSSHAADSGDAAVSSPAAAGAMVVVDPSLPTHDNDGAGPDRAANGSLPAGGQEDVHAKKSEAAIEQYIEDMLSREEERRAKWAQQQAAKAAEEHERLNHPTLNPKTDELAERARARYRMREEQKKLLQEAEEAKRQQEEKELAERVGQRRFKPKPPQSFQRDASSKEQKAGTAAGGTAPKEREASRALSANTPARRSLGAEFYEHQQKTEERKYRHLELLRLQQAEEELKECTFRPRLNTASERMAQRVLVESYDIPDDDTPRTGTGASKSASAHDGLQGYRVHSSSLPRSVDVSCHNGQSPFISPRSRSLLQELHVETPTQGPTRRDFTTSSSESETAERAGTDDHAENFTLQVQPIRLNPASVSQPRAVDTPQRSPEPLSAQLRNLEEMLREWKELERECSPMLRQRPQAGLVE